MKFYICIIISLCCLIPALSDNNVLSLPDVILSLEKNYAGYKENILTLAKAEAAYKEGKAILYPVISITAPLNYQYNPQSVLGNAGSTEIKTLNADSLVISPEISLNQFLPTAGSLGVSFKNNFSQIRMGDISPDEYLSIAEQQYKFLLDPVYKNTPQLTVSLTQPLTLENKFQAGLTLVETSFAIAKSNFRISRNLMVYNAAKSFSEVQFLKASLTIAESACQAVDNVYQETAQNYKLGRTTYIELLKAQAALKKAQLDLVNAQDAYNLAFTRFCTTFGIDPGSRVTADAFALSISNNNKAEITAAALSNNPELQAAGKNCEIGRANLTLAKAADAFVLGLGADYTFNTTESNITDPGRAFVSPFTESGNPVFSFSITLSGKLFDGNGKRQKVKQAAHDLELAELALAGKKQGLLSQAEQWLSTLVKNESNVDYRKMNLEIAVLEYNNSQKDLELGQISRMEFQTIARDLDTARLSLVQAQNELLLAGLELLMFTGADLWVYFQKGSV